MGTAATCPFIMSEQSPRTTKLFHSVYARSNNQALRQTEIYTLYKSAVRYIFYIAKRLL